MTRLPSAILSFSAIALIMGLIWLLTNEVKTPAIVPVLTDKERAVCEEDRRRNKIGNYTIVKGENGAYFDFGRCVDKPPGELCGKRWCRR